MSLTSFCPLIKKTCIVCFLFISVYCQAQKDVTKFQQEVDQITMSTPVPDAKNQVYLFTGSSSIRLWEDLTDYFPEQPIINTGFGGSQSHELLHYAEELIINYSPKKIFIYEGDNDIAAGKSPSSVFKTMQKLIAKIHGALPDAEIILISAKPSISRWHLSEDYQNLNRLLKVYSQKTKRVHFVDVWPIMLDKNGKPIQDIFVEDGLHMNAKGYGLWAESIAPHIP